MKNKLISKKTEAILSSYLHSWQNYLDLSKQQRSQVLDIIVSYKLTTRQVSVITGIPRYNLWLMLRNISTNKVEEVVYQNYLKENQIASRFKPKTNTSTNART